MINSYELFVILLLYCYIYNNIIESIKRIYLSLDYQYHKKILKKNLPFNRRLKSLPKKILNQILQKLLFLFLPFLSFYYTVKLTF